MEDFKSEFADILFLATRTEELSVERLFEVVDKIADKVLSVSKKQMMKDAVEGIVHPDDQEIWCDISKYNFKDGDKIKILVFKEDLL